MSCYSYNSFESQARHIDKGIFAIISDIAHQAQVSLLLTGKFETGHIYNGISPIRLYQLHLAKLSTLTSYSC